MDFNGTLETISCIIFCFFCLSLIYSVILLCVAVKKQNKHVWRILYCVQLSALIMAVMFKIYAYNSFYFGYVPDFITSLVYLGWSGFGSLIIIVFSSLLLISIVFGLLINNKRKRQ